jgi:ABC-type phosphate transport system ATPase subunit
MEISASMLLLLSVRGNFIPCALSQRSTTKPVPEVLPWVSIRIQFENVNKWYDKYHALADIDAVIAKGEVVVVCGPSGSGKSILIRTVNRLEEIQQGRIFFDGQDVHAKSLNVTKFRSHVGFVFQSFNLFPHLSVAENIMLAPVSVLRKSKPMPGPVRCNCSSAWVWRIRARWSSAAARNRSSPTRRASGHASSCRICALID